MKLTKPAAMNAFLCPGVGHFVAGWRVTGAFLVTLTVLSVLTPFLAFIWGLLTPPECWEALGTCLWLNIRHAWSVTWPSLLVCVPLLATVYVSALAHGLTLRLPNEREGTAS